MSKSIFHFILFSVVILFVLIAGHFCYNKFFRAESLLPTTIPPPLVFVTEIEDASELETQSFPGIAKESQIANLSFRVSGQIIESDIKIGVKISQGAVLARLDPRDYELAVKRLEAELQSAEVMLGAMKTGARPEDIATLQSQLTAASSAYETAETNLKRFTALLSDQVASQFQFDLAKTQFDSAKGQKETLENELEKAQHGSRKEEIESTEAKILGLRANLNVAKNSLVDTVLKAPFDGIAVEKFVGDHEVVAPGMPVVSFVDVSYLDIALNIPEEMIVRMNEIQSYRIEFESYPEKIFSATLKEIGLAVQRGRQSYPLLIRVEIPATDAEYKIFPGMTAMVRIDLKRQVRPLLIPIGSLFGENKESFVWEVESDHVKRHPVKILRLTDNGAEIERTLNPHCIIVTAGAKKLKEGQTIRIK